MTRFEESIIPQRAQKHVGNTGYICARGQILGTKMKLDGIPRAPRATATDGAGLLLWPWLFPLATLALSLPQGPSPPSLAIMQNYICF